MGDRLEKTHAKLSFDKAIDINKEGRLKPHRVKST
jgi:hypothetical protein